LLDTSNYYPMRDGNIAALDRGQVESLWVSEHLGRPVVKAWNAITANSFNTKNAAAGSPERIAIPVAADSDDARAVGLSLVDDTGFDGFDTGALRESWRQQPGTPAYCTDLTRDELKTALDAAVPGRAPARRDLAMSVIVELMSDTETDRGEDFVVRVNRLIYP
jgi:predicted dinucleotide-binding enzyme